MVITRVFRVKIYPEMRDEFERKFADISVRVVKEAVGFIAVEIYKPTKWQPDEYMMISQWQDEAAVKAFAGENWNQAVIPTGMAQFVEACWVHHGEEWA
jgi:quinol monooxygenase YgiN